MTAINDLSAAVTTLQEAVFALDTRLIAYPPETYDADIQLATATINATTAALNALAPTPEARALELRAVE